MGGRTTPSSGQYQWTLRSEEARAPSGAAEQRAERDPPSVPGGTGLLNLQRYSVTLRADLQPEYYGPAFATKFFNTSATPLVASIRGGALAREHLSTLALELDGSGSYDPDRFSGGAHDWLWTCTKRGGVSAAPQACSSELSSANVTAAVLRLAAGALTDDYTYAFALRFRVTVANALAGGASYMREATAAVNVTATDQAVTSVTLVKTVDGNSGWPHSSVPTSSVLRIEAQCVPNSLSSSTAGDLTFSWSVAPAISQTLPAAAAAGLAPNTLSPGVTYTFSVTVTDPATGVDTLASTTVQAAALPTITSSTVTPSEGLQFVTEFTVSVVASGDFPPFEYSYATAAPGGQPRALTGYASQSTHKTTFTSLGRRRLSSRFVDSIGGEFEMRTDNVTVRAMSASLSPSATATGAPSGTPSMAPATAGPTAAPASLAPTTPGQTRAPSGSPSTSCPTASPSSAGPTASPVTDSPASAAPTGGPTASPATAGPTAVPSGRRHPPRAPLVTGVSHSPATSGPQPRPPRHPPRLARPPAQRRACPLAPRRRPRRPRRRRSTRSACPFSTALATLKAVLPATNGTGGVCGQMSRGLDGLINGGQADRAIVTIQYASGFVEALLNATIPCAPYLDFGCYVPPRNPSKTAQALWTTMNAALVRAVTAQRGAGRPSSNAVQAMTLVVESATNISNADLMSYVDLGNKYAEDAPASQLAFSSYGLDFANLYAAIAKRAARMASSDPDPAVDLMPHAATRDAQGRKIDASIRRRAHGWDVERRV